MDAAPAPSAFFLAQLERIRAASDRGPVIDLACGRGRHALAAAERGIPILGVDRNPAFLAELRAASQARGLPVSAVRADLEAPPGFPLAPGSCAAILVFRYLHRPLAPLLVEALQPGGLLVYETFTIHQKTLGYGPGNPDFLLKPGELPQLFAALEVIETWEGRTQEDRPAVVARLAARRR